MRGIAAQLIFRAMFVRFLALGAMCLGAPGLAAQGPGGGPGPIRVFLDCQSLNCDFDHLRREIPFVNWVRDRTASDVHVLGTGRGAGAGGQEVTLAFIGQGRFGGQVDTLTYTDGSTDTDDERRARLTRVLSLGLVRFAMRSDAAPRLAVRYEAPDTAAPEEPPHDPWNFWVFRVGGNTSLDGESRQSEIEFRGNASANRVTEAWKLSVNFSGEYGREEFELSADSVFVATRRSWNAFALTAWSINDHWSVGGLVDAGHSLFRNHTLRLETGPAIEFSVFPYAESSRRRFTVLYGAGLAVYRYQDTTVFGKIAETRPLQVLDVGVDFRQPWGNLFGGLGGQQFLDDLAQHRIGVFSGINLRIVRGLSLNVFADAARVKNQINIAAGDLSPEEIIVQQRQLGTDFSYSLSVGLTYTFGSIFSNVVNPRF
ncbi:MAG: hypothetical protein WD043_09825 [Gemmatimonadales bacterium]